MALYAFDGTWNEDKEQSIADTNVVKFRDAYTGKNKHYLSGVGTRFGKIGRILGGTFGAGGKQRIEEMYDFLVENWKKNDQDIDIIGFSRGAALAVHFSNLITKEGIKDGNTTLESKPQIRFLGVWDIVASFGIPINIGINFHDINIGYDLTGSFNAKHCFHAMAINERRESFDVTRLNEKHDKPNFEEVWFRGVHSDVGGGNKNVSLSNISLGWMLNHAHANGLPVKKMSKQRQQQIDVQAPISHNFDPLIDPKRKFHTKDQVHPSVIGRTLDVNEEVEFTVHAREQFNWSGVRVQKGQHYTFQIQDGDNWQDKDLVCGPKGWESEQLSWIKAAVVKTLEDNRRCPSANWFELVGSIGDEEDKANFFRIADGKNGATFTPSQDGELFAFANDVRTMYGNNTGDIDVTVKRVEAPGHSKL